MILPSKHLSQDRALLGIGGEVLGLLDEDKTVSELWESLRTSRARPGGGSTLSYDWFVLSLTFLYTIAAVDFYNGLVSAREKE